MRADGAVDSNAGPIPVSAAASHDAESRAATVGATIPPSVVVSSDATLRAGSTAGAKPVSGETTSAAARPVDSDARSPVSPATAAAAMGPGGADSSAATIPVRGAASPAAAAQEIVVVSNVPRTPENVAASNAGAIPVTGAMSPVAASARVKSPVREAVSIEARPVVDTALGGMIPATGAMSAVATPADVEGSDAVVPPASTAMRDVTTRASGVGMTRRIGAVRARIVMRLRAVARRIVTTGHLAATRRRNVVVAAKAPVSAAAGRRIGVLRGRKNPTCRTTSRPVIWTRPSGVTCSAWTKAMRRRSRAIS